MNESFPDLPSFGPVTESRRLAGGAHETTWLLTCSDDSQLVVKAGDHLPAGLLLAEAEGLSAIAGSGSLAAPTVIHVGPSALVLEALLPSPTDDTIF